MILFQLRQLHIEKVEKEWLEFLIEIQGRLFYTMLGYTRNRPLDDKRDLRKSVLETRTYNDIISLVESLSFDEMPLLTEIIGDMYDSGHYRAIDFTRCAGLKELIPKVEEQLSSSDARTKIMALYVLRKFESKESYEKAFVLLGTKGNKGIEKNILITLSKLDFDRTLHYLEDYLLLSNKDEAWFVAYNVLYDLFQKSSNKSNDTSRLTDIIKKRPDGDLLLKDSYEKAMRMIEEKDDED